MSKLDQDISKRNILILHALVAQAVERTTCPCPSLQNSACLLDADLRHNAVNALYPVQPCPKLLQPARQLWHSQQQQNPSEQILPAQPISQQYPSPLKATLPQLSVPQQNKDIPEADYSAVLPPLPESRVSMLRQQARLHSLHLSEDAEEEEQTVPDQHKSVDDEEEEGPDNNIQMPADLRVGCCQSMVFKCHISITSIVLGSGLLCLTTSIVLGGASAGQAAQNGRRGGGGGA